MPKDKYRAIWLSHSSINDFLQCPRAYYLGNVYKNPRTGRKINLIKPPLALGQAIHTVIDELSTLTVDKRFDEPLDKRFEKAWGKVAGVQGGFVNEAEEKAYKMRGSSMIVRISKNPGPLARRAVKIKMDLPHYWLSEEDNLILCGRIDWLEYVPDDDTVHIIDFKTGKLDEKEDSLQLPIYYLLAYNCQSHEVSGASYWYLDRRNHPTDVELPELEDARKQVMEVARRVKLARKLDHYKCSIDEKKGCVACAPLQAIVDGRAKFVGVGEFNQELYVLSDEAGSL